MFAHMLWEPFGPERRRLLGLERGGPSGEGVDYRAIREPAGTPTGSPYVYRCLQLSQERPERSAPHRIACILEQGRITPTTVEPGGILSMC
jgi:hypothetical protein